MKKLEELLNKLIEKGWKPFGDENVKEIKIYSDMDMECIYGKRKSDFYYFSPRKITSKESGLWQFICDNGMRPKRVGYAEHYWQRDHHTNGRGMVMESDPEYRIIESSLIDEDKLEKFLLDNIKIDG